MKTFRIMKMYKKPIIEVFDLKGENLMQGITTSPQGGGPGGGTGNDAPRRRGDIID